MSFGLYVHWPYCESKCPYCDFNSHIADTIDPTRWIDAYRQELLRVSRQTSDEILSTIFIGGGTPSLMRPEIVAAIIETALSNWRSINDVEISMEANPGSVDAGRFKDYRAAGVNRVSLGIQSLDDSHLRLLGRKHSRRDAFTAIKIAQDTFDRVNLDLMYGRQHQTVNDWREELRTAISFETRHLSLYQLTIEDGTVFGRRFAAGQLLGLPDEDCSVEFFNMTQELCDAAGLPAYEVSNHAFPGEECRHNMIYWSGQAYAGIGPGAHGRLRTAGSRIATEAISAPAAWLAAVEQTGSGDLVHAEVEPADQAIEGLLMGLRLSSGISEAELTRLRIKTESWRSLDIMRAAGFVEWDGRTLRATRQGRLLLNAVLSELTSDLRLFQT